MSGSEVLNEYLYRMRQHILRFFDQKVWTRRFCKWGKFRGFLIDGHLPGNQILAHLDQEIEVYLIFRSQIHTLSPTTKHRRSSIIYLISVTGWDGRDLKRLDLTALKRKSFRKRSSFCFYWKLFSFICTPQNYRIDCTRQAVGIIHIIWMIVKSNSFRFLI